MSLYQQYLMAKYAKANDMSQIKKETALELLAGASGGLGGGLYGHMFGKPWHTGHKPEFYKDLGKEIRDAWNKYDARVSAEMRSGDLRAHPRAYAQHPHNMIKADAMAKAVEEHPRLLKSKHVAATRLGAIGGFALGAGLVNALHKADHALEAYKSESRKKYREQKQLAKQAARDDRRVLDETKAELLAGLGGGVAGGLTSELVGSSGPSLIDKTRHDRLVKELDAIADGYKRSLKETLKSKVLTKAEKKEEANYYRNLMKDRKYQSKLMQEAARINKYKRNTMRGFGALGGALLGSGIASAASKWRRYTDPGNIVADSNI